MSRNKLSDEAKTYVVRALACFRKPAEIQAEIRKEYGVEVTLQSIEGYDPNKSAGAKLSKRWRTLFAETRKAFTEDLGGIGLSHKAVRIQTLQRALEKAEKQGNTALVVQITVEAEKIMGELYTNRRQITGKDGKPLFPANPPQPVAPTMTPREAAEAYQSTLNGVDD